MQQALLKVHEEAWNSTYRFVDGGINFYRSEHSSQRSTKKAKTRSAGEEHDVLASLQVMHFGGV